MPRRVVVTGIGVVNPCGVGKEAFARRLFAGESAIAPITRFDASGFPVRVAGEVRDFDPTAVIPRRFVVKTDRFTHYALAAAEEAIGDARLSLGDEDPYRVGVWFGNNAGGWDICERGFKELYRDGASLVNPWQATAWFPTAAQGYVTIRYGIRGYSKSFVCDRASGASALHFAARAIKNDQLDVVLAGGSEAPLTSFGLTCYVETGELRRAMNHGEGCMPFDRDRDGIVLGEGSTVLVLEELEHARRRGARILGEICGSAMTTDSDPSRGDAFVRAIEHAASLVDRVDVVFAEGCGIRASDEIEALAIARALGQVPVTVPKSLFGHLYGASGATELACGLLSMERSAIPRTDTRNVDRHCPIDLVTERRDRELSSFVVQSRAREGVNVAIAVRAFA